MEQPSSKAIEYQVTTSCLENSSTEKGWRLREYSGSYHNLFTLLKIFLLVIHFGYCLKQDTGQDRHLAKPSVIFILLQIDTVGGNCDHGIIFWSIWSTRVIWELILISFTSGYLTNSLTPFSQHITAVYWIILL